MARAVRRSGSIKGPCFGSAVFPGCGDDQSRNTRLRRTGVCPRCASCVVARSADEIKVQALYSDRPPSIGKAAPVTADAAGPATQTMAAATSSARIRRSIGCPREKTSPDSSP